MGIICEKAEHLAFPVCFFHVFSPASRCISLGISRGCHGFLHDSGGETKNDGHPPLLNTARLLAPVPNFALRDEAKRARTCRGGAHCTKSHENTPPQHAPDARKIADGASKRHDTGQKTQEKEKNGQKNGNEPSHDETFPHRTYIEMKKLSRNLVVNVTTSTTMVGAVSLTPRKYGQKSNRPNIYPIFFIQIVNDFATF